MFWPFLRLKKKKGEKGFANRLHCMKYPLYSINYNLTKKIIMNE
jgi:hypothetical protein